MCWRCCAATTLRRWSAIRATTSRLSIAPTRRWPHITAVRYCAQEARRSCLNGAITAGHPAVLRGRQRYEVCQRDDGRDCRRCRELRSMTTALRCRIRSDTADHCVRVKKRRGRSPRQRPDGRGRVCASIRIRTRAPFRRFPGPSGPLPAAASGSAPSSPTGGRECP